METKLVVNGVEAKIGVEFLESIASSLPDKEYYQEICHELAQHSSASVKAEIAYKDNISTDTASLLLEDKDPKVLENILRSESVKEFFNDQHFEKILETKNEELISTLIDNLDEYQEVDIDKCLDEILALNDDYLTRKIADNYSTPKKILKKLLKHNDPDIVEAAKSSLE